MMRGKPAELKARLFAAGPIAKCRFEIQGLESCDNEHD
jgi:hypothetical protein